MNDINDIMNDIVKYINDKGPFPLHEQSWYKTALLNKRTTINNDILDATLRRKFPCALQK